MLEPSRRSADLSQSLAERLTAWAASRGVTAAGLYAVCGGVANRVAEIGGSFPERLEGDAGVDGTKQIALPSARLLVRAASEPEVDDPEILLLAAGVRIQQLAKELEEHHFQARFRGVEQENLYEVGLAIASMLDLENLGEEVLFRAVSLLDARRGALYLIEDQQYRLLSSFGGGDVESAFAIDDERVQALQTEDSDTAHSPLAGSRHVLAVPIEIERSPRGMLLVADKESRRGVGPFPTSDRRTLSLFANQAAIALENAKLHRLALEKERLEREMELAAEIQQQLLPKAMPEILGFEVLGWNRPARQVGGDYFDLRQLADTRWTLVVGDVTGKGMPAALLVSTLHTALNLLGDRMEIGPDMAARLNRHIFESSSSNKFITMLLAELDSASGILRYLNAGHNPGLVARADGAVDTLPSGGMPLGLLAHAKFGDAVITMAPGDLVCLYSDGITEAANAAGDEFGFDRLTDLLLANQDMPLQDLVAKIDEETSAFSAGLPQGDDQTVVLVRRRP